MKALLLAVALAGCGAGQPTLRSRCQDAEVLYSPVQIALEAAVTQPLVDPMKKQMLKSLDLYAMDAIRACETAADIGNAAEVAHYAAVVQDISSRAAEAGIQK